MPETSVTVSASSPEEALTEAASRLQCLEGDITLIPLEGDSYRAELTDRNARVQVDVSADKTQALISAYIPARGKGSPLSAEDLLSALKQAGVRLEIPKETVSDVLRSASRGEDVSGVVLVRAIAPSPAEDASVQPLGDWDFPVFPGDEVGIYVPPRPARDGKLVTGEVDPSGSAEKPRDITIPQDGGCRLESDSSRIVSERYGLVRLEEQKIKVAPLIRVTNNKMAVKADIYPRTADGRSVTAELFKDVLRRMEIKAKLRENTLMRAVQEAEKQGSPVEAFICRRLDPKNGEDGRFELAVRSASESSVLGREASDGSIDYRARDRISAVQPGDLLGRLIPPQAGVSSQDVYGHPVPAKDGRPCEIRAGENVRVSEDGSEFYADCEGMVVYSDNTLRVTEVLEINGDVDLSVGNILLERGSVNITGSVLAGLKVEAPGSVVVGNVVEDAVISAGGDVSVGYGIVMSHEGRVDAGGNISAMYAQNAVLSAGGDVDIAHEIKNCSVYAGGSVNATKGRGKVFGGVLHCAEGLVARQVGSPLGVETFVYLGVDKDTGADFKRKKEIKENLEKIYNSLGSGDVREILDKAPAQKRQMVAKVLRARLEMEKELKQIKERLKEKRESLSCNEKIRVKALETIHPDVIISCVQSRYKVTETLSAPVIIYDAVQRKLVLG